MMVKVIKDVTKFHKPHLGGWGMLKCVCTGRRQLQSSVLM